MPYVPIIIPVESGSVNKCLSEKTMQHCSYDHGNSGSYTCITECAPPTREQIHNQDMQVFIMVGLTLLLVSFLFYLMLKE